MKCRRCNEEFNFDEPMRCEPVTPGSPHYVYYHWSCWYTVKEERQRRNTSEDT